MTSPPAPKRRLWPALTIGLIAVVMIVVVIFSYSPTDANQASEQSPQETATEPQEQQRVDLARRDSDDPLAIGELDAPVSLVMYSDFQCGYCAMWTINTLPTMLEYVEDGQLRIEWRDVAFFGEDSYQAALAGYAAGKQDHYPEFTQALFSSGSAPSPKTLTDEGLEETAKELGLDVEQFNRDRASTEASTQVGENIAEAQAIGASGTPAFLLNGIAISGAQPTEYFTQLIDIELGQNS